MSSLSVRTLSGLPEYNNAIVVQSGHKLIIPGTPTNILQAVKTDAEAISVTSGTGTPTTSNTFPITGLSLTITPASANSRFLLIADLSYVAGFTAAWVFFRGTSPVGIGDAANNRRRVTGAPAATTPITYSIRAMGDTSALFYVNRSPNDSDNTTGVRPISTLTVMELL
ncbi:MAG: hypothetical protein EBX98_05240 [Burkholderiaceae bacterium]|nr:hypothetical protein [Burkholderiaceae bacterium]